MKQSTIIKILWLKLRKNRKNDFRLLRKWHFVCNKFANYANADWRTGQAKPQQSTLRRPALPNAYHAYLRQNSRRNTAFPKTECGKSYDQKTLPAPPLKGGNPKSPFKTLSNSPLKGENSSLPLREGQGGSKSPFPGSPKNLWFLGWILGDLEGRFWKFLLK